MSADGRFQTKNSYKFLKTLCPPTIIKPIIAICDKESLKGIEPCKENGPKIAGNLVTCYKDRLPKEVRNNASLYII